ERSCKLPTSALAFCCPARQRLPPYARSEGSPSLLLVRVLGLRLSSSTLCAGAALVHALLTPGPASTSSLSETQAVIDEPAKADGACRVGQTKTRTSIRGAPTGGRRPPLN